MISDTVQQNMDELIATWERQQSAYVRNRAARFGIILDAIRYARPNASTILDLGGGLGSFSKLLLQRFPQARVLTLDFDPSLLTLARHNLRHHANRSTILEADLRNTGWPEALNDDTPDVIVSSTALHWLSRSDIITVFSQLAVLLPQGGLFFNADHYSSAVPGEFLRTVAAADDTAHQAAAFADGTPEWATWWDSVRRVEPLANLVAERDRRFADRTDGRDVTATFHTEALRLAGFREAGTIWQYFDDYVVYGTR